MDIHDKEQFNDPAVLTALREKLKNNEKFVVEMIFHISDDMEKAKKELIEECPRLISIWREFPGRFHIFWDPKAKKQHHVVNDREDVILEEFGHPPAQRPWFDVVFNLKRLAEKWIKWFEKSKEGCIELQF